MAPSPAVPTSAPPTAAVRRRRHRQAGFIGLTDALLGLAVAALVLPAVITMTNQQTRELQDQAAAAQLKAVGEASAAFVRDNFGKLYAQMGSGANLGVAGSDILDVAVLTNAAYLPVNFAARNSFGQTPVVLLRKVAQDPAGGPCPDFSTGPPACKWLIEALIVTTGGQALDRAHASHVATLTGAHAGIVDDGAKSARGSFGAWCVDFSQFGGVAGSCPVHDNRAALSQSLASAAYTYAAPAAGHLAMALFFNGSEMMSEYLNRFDTGNPEDNTMHTALLMDQKDITQVHTVQIAGIDTGIAGADQGFEANRMNMVNNLYNGLYAANDGKLTAATSISAPAFWYTSDARLKTHVQPLDHALDRLLAVRGVSYDWRQSGQHDIGVVAQEVAKSFPELVAEGGDGVLRVKYGNFVGPLIEGLRELAARNQALQREVAGLKSRPPAAAAAAAAADAPATESPLHR